MSALFWTLPKSLTRKNWIPVFPDSPCFPDLLDDSQKDMIPDGADEVLDLFQKLLEHRLKNTPTEKRDQQAEVLANELDMHKSYLFHRMEPDP